MIYINSLHKYFNKGRTNEIHVIDNVTLTLPQKGMVAIFGKSGCGKTTLLNTIGGLDNFYSGEIRIENENITSDTDRVRNKYMGYIFQNYNLNKNETCFENVANALYLCGITDKDIIEKRVMTALTNVGMEKYHNRTPDTLSGGQQQRIAIARAIVKNPPIILADEPTGNLDEANTIMIMDLLKEISREHLVLLVTHEANLVDFYCDKVIELSDGKVVSIKENENADGYSQKDKNTIYLGEFEKSVSQDDKISVEYYGETPPSPLKLKVIYKEGKTYIKIESDEVSIVSPTSEIKLKEGVFVQKQEEQQKKGTFQMADLPPVEGTRFGRLFNFKKAVKSGYAEVSLKGKKGKKLIRRCLAFFAAVLVFMFAMLGTAISSVFDIKESYNNNVFYVSTTNGETSLKLNEAVGKAESGIDYVKLFYSIPQGDANIPLHIGNFETYENFYMDSGYSTNGVVLDIALAKDLKLVAGKKDNLEYYEAVITSKSADKILEQSDVGYIKDYKDLLGLIVSRGLSIDGRNARISGIVESDETAIYLSESSVAKYMNQRSSYNVCLDEDKKLDLAENETILFVYSELSKENMPSVGDTVKIGGQDIKVKAVYSRKDYAEYLKENNITKKEEQEFFEELMKKSENSEYGQNFEKLYNEKYAEYVMYYYSEYDSYLKEQAVLYSDDFAYWLYVEKNINVVLNNIDPRLYSTVEYQKANGVYPTLEQINTYYNFKTLDEYREIYYIEFYSQNSFDRKSDFIFALDSTNYVKLSKQIGDTNSLAWGSGRYNDYYDDYYYYEDDYYYGDDYYYYEETVYLGEMAKPETNTGASSGTVDADGTTVISTFDRCYTVVHSVNPELTEKWLKEQFPNFSDMGDLAELVTPANLFDQKFVNIAESVIGSFITMAVFLAIMSVCMFLIMRSSLMNKIKEIGIYRAIGVSKKNLVYRFTIESLILAVFTVLKGYALSSGFIFACKALSPTFENIFFYPLWMGLLVLSILFGLCVICGIIPIRMLLRKTPSQILAKFDI